MTEEVRALQRLAMDLKLGLDEASEDLAAASRSMQRALSELALQREEMQAFQRALSLKA